MNETGRTILLISSHVVRGSVGNRVMSFALERLGFSVWAVPTIVLPHHPGQGPGERIVPEDAAFEALLGDIAGTPDAILSGYLGTSAQADLVADHVRRARSENPDCLYLCDPILGDRGGLYVTDRIAATIGDDLLPLADIATPNAFECAWLAGREGKEDEADLAVAARALAPSTVIVTSHPGLMRNHIGNLLVESDTALLAEHHTVESRAKGTGDLFAALYLGRLMQEREPRKALEMATASTFQMIAAAARLDADDLPMAQAQAAIAQPTAMVNLRQMAPKLSMKPRPL
jgi:pyridoxine kinase